MHTIHRRPAASVQLPAAGGKLQRGHSGKLHSCIHLPQHILLVRCRVHPERAWLSALFDHFIANHTVSTALQAVITTLARIEYYQRTRRFDKSDNVSLVFFEYAYTLGDRLDRKDILCRWGLPPFWLCSR